MANIKSNDKYKKQSDKRNLRNKSTKSEIKSSIKKSIGSKNIDDINRSVSLINKAVNKGVFHKNKAARLTSKMHSLENK